LTNNEYTLVGGERLITVEFTKLDPRTYEVTGDNRQGSTGAVLTDFVLPFREPTVAIPDGRDHPIRINLAKTGVALVESSLPAFDARIAHQDKKLRRWITGISLAGIIAFLALLLSLGGIMWQATGEMRSVAARERQVLERYDVQRDKVTDSVAVMRERLQAIERVICAQADADARQRARLKLAPGLRCQ
jgi:hypothetical protein